ncbi:hypothetical protein Ana3638_11765 [Anaerocolumna sedimenticola]|uniref:Uncharacterized protein n=1 Tax=Anaerocolumna sedimenticola TaxID=2696063 RepID=A0A6P1TNH7_9FIRM|nr:hypothetical protein [Anaerocolumna sedimenticola]QHQ61366.1 hypothetical protein Ana3638_11765 [Anaerocolumna sedimenticola]
MFINPTHLKKLMTAAYKGGGIRIGYFDEGYIIIAGTWMVWLDVNYIPNKVKAIIMELAGVLPEEDTVFIVSKEKPMPQTEMDIHSYFHINTLEKEAKYPVTLSNVLLDKHFNVYRLMQVNESKQLVMMDMNHLNLIDLNEIDYDQENTLSGPCTNFGQSMYFWRNATCTLLLMGTAVPAENPVITALSVIDFEKEAKK